MHPIDPKDTLSALLDIIVHIVEHRYDCQLWTWGSGKKMDEETVDSSSGPAKKEGNHSPSQTKSLHSAFHVLESHTTELMLEGKIYQMRPWRSKGTSVKLKRKAQYKESRVP